MRVQWVMQGQCKGDAWAPHMRCTEDTFPLTLACTRITR